MQIRHKKPIVALLSGLAALTFLAGCGGGGGGSSSSNNGNNGGGGGSSKTASLSGKLTEKSNGYVLPYRTITVQGTSISTTTDASGNFTLSGVPTGTVTFVIKDNTGFSNGSPTYTVTSGQTTLNIVLDFGNNPPGSPPI